MGWKAIADYLGVSVPTATRYTRDYHLPVVRFIGRNVWTLPSVVDRWVIGIDAAERSLQLMGRFRGPILGAKPVPEDRGRDDEQ